MQTSTNYPRLGIMGGTFDPIHHGHLVAASEVADLFSLDRVLFVPTGQPWQKKNRTVTPAEDRYLMTTIATASNPRFSVSRVDIDRGGPTYTVDTLHDLHERYPHAELFFITGADAVARMATWRDCTEMMSLATFVAVTRPGYSLEKTELGPLGIVSRWWRCRLWRFRRRIFARVQGRIGLFGISCPMVWCNTLRRKSCTCPRDKSGRRVCGRP